MSDTPETDAARLNISCDDSSCGIYCHTTDDSEYTGEVCRADRMADLERQRNEAREENARLREALRFASDALLWSLEKEPSPCRCLDFANPPHVCVAHRAINLARKLLTP